MTWATVAAAISAKLTGLGISNVIIGDPYTSRPDELITLLGNPLHGWVIVRVGVETDEQRGDGRRYRVRHQGVLRGYLGLTGTAVATEAALNVDVDTIVTGLRHEATIWVEVPEDVPRGVPGGTISHTMIGQHLVHFAELRLTVDEFEMTAI